MSKDSVKYFVQKHITNTGYKRYVQDKTINLGNINSQIKSSLNIKSSKIHITSKSLKHIYDKHTYKHNLTSEFEFIVTNLRKTTTKPELITTNKGGRRGSYCFIKRIKKQYCY